MDEAVDGQIKLLAETRLNASPTHGLYTDESFELEPYMDDCILDPICEAEDYQGVKGTTIRHIRAMRVTIFI